MKTFLGIDNGVTGSMCVMNIHGCGFYKTPIVLQQSYTKEKQNISRLDCDVFFALIGGNHIDLHTKKVSCIAIIERPMVNPKRWKSSLSAIRCLEATLICLETLKIPYQYCDSKEWQREMLPQFKGNAIKKDMPKKEKDRIKKAKALFLKTSSVDIGCRLFPQFKEQIIKHKDADSLLMAEWARRQNL